MEYIKMAQNLAPGFQGIDFNQWRNWPTVQTKTGQVYYELPNNPAMVYSPYDNRIYDNPNNADKFIQEQNDKKKKEGLSPIEQVGVLGLGGAAVYGGQELGKAGIGGTIENIAKLPGKVSDVLGLGGSSSAGASEAVQGASNVMGLGGGSAISAGTSTLPAGAAIPEGFTAVGTAVDGGTLIAPSSVAGSSGAGAFSLGGIGSAGNAILPIAGVAGAYDLFTSDKRGTGSGIAQGAASGAAIGSYFGPIGAGVGGVLGGILGAFGGKPRTKLEEERLGKLNESGIKTFTPPEFDESRGRSQQLSDIKKEMGISDDFIGYTPDGHYANARWLKSGKESDLRAQDIWGYATFSEHFGNDWYNTSEENREKIASKALDLGLIKEHHGTIDITGKNKDQLLDYADRVLGGQDSEEESTVSKWSVRPDQNAQTQANQTSKAISNAGSKSQASDSDITGQGLKPTATLPDGQTAYARGGVPVNSVNATPKKLGVKR